MGSKKSLEDDSLLADVPREIELKLAIDPEAIETLPRHPLLTRARRAPEQGGSLYAVYFDTEAQDLRRAGLSLRLRRQGNGWVQTIKADSGARGAVMERDEWEAAVEGEALDWRAVQGTALGLLLETKDVKDRIRPAFTVTTDRQAYLLDRNRTRIELVLDRAEIAAGGRSQRFGEIELEVKRGKANAVFGVALDLVEAAPVRLSRSTKSGRGYALLDGLAPKPVKADRVALDPGCPSAQAFQAIARSCLAQAVENEAIVREHREADAVHQFRVGLRRLRAAASLFGDLISDAESRKVRDELRWMNHSLGPIRDLDVLIARLRAAPDHEQSLAAAQRRRDEACGQLLARLDEPRFRRATLLAAAWIEAGRWLTLGDPALRELRDEPVESRAARELRKRRKRVLKRARRLEELDPEARHQVRIEIKKLRYGVEFFGRLFSGAKAKSRRKRILAATEHLQEILGELNDLAVGGRLLAPAAAGSDGSSAEPEGLADALLARARRIYDDLAGTKPFWN
jgi:inorganic triphosphatase YgiF